MHGHCHVYPVKLLTIQYNEGILTTRTAQEAPERVFYVATELSEGGFATELSEGGSAMNIDWHPGFCTIRWSTTPTHGESMYHNSRHSHPAFPFLPYACAGAFSTRSFRQEEKQGTIASVTTATWTEHRTPGDTPVLTPRGPPEESVLMSETA